MDGEKVRRLYTQKARLYRRLFIDVLGWEKQLRRFFESFNYLKPNMRILDAGCGTGVITKSLYLMGQQQGITGLQLHAFDLTLAMLDIFREWLAEQHVHTVELRQADVLFLDQQLPSDWREYDLVVSSAMLEYIPSHEIEKAIGHLRELLKEEGVLLLFLTRRNLLTSWLGQMWWKTQLFEEGQIQQILQQAGFNTVRFRPFLPIWSTSIMVVEARK